MITNFKYNTPATLYTPVVFREDFKDATISATQAWSLFLTAGQEENLLGEESEIGWFYNNFLIAWVVAFGLAAAFFSAPFSALF